MTDFPLFLYEYDADGRYGKPLKIAGPPGLEFAMATTVKQAIAEKREVRITDTSDFLVFHAENGEIIWPTRGGPDGG